jgi:rSAM/selenodomain-associated transferase 2
MISVIIPTLNEQDYIADTIRYLREIEKPDLFTEIIVCDGGSSDLTVQEAENAGADRVIISRKKGRSAQMNYGASFAKGDILYFLHSDTIPPPGFAIDIANAHSNGIGAGCFTLSFDHKHWFLKANCWFTRFNFNSFRFGDQSLFVATRIFRQSGGFCEKHQVLEDQEIIKRIKLISRFTVIQKPVITSARKYLANGIYKTQGVFFLIYLMYKLGCSQERLMRTYKGLMRQA